MHRHADRRINGRGVQRRLQPTLADLVVCSDRRRAERRVIQREVLHRALPEQFARVTRHPVQRRVGEVSRTRFGVLLRIGHHMAVHVRRDLFFSGSFGVDHEGVVMPLFGAGSFEQRVVVVFCRGLPDSHREVRTRRSVRIDQEPAGMRIEVRRELERQFVVTCERMPLHPELDRQLMRPRQIDFRMRIAGGSVEQRRPRSVTHQRPGFAQAHPARHRGVRATNHVRERRARRLTHRPEVGYPGRTFDRFAIGLSRRRRRRAQQRGRR